MIQWKWKMNTVKGDENVLKPEPMGNAEEPEIPYSYSREYNEYENIKLERHVVSYDSSKAKSSGKMNCDVWIILH